MKRHRGRTIEQRIFDMIEVVGSCWVWTGFYDNSPKIRISSKSVDVRWLLQEPHSGDKRRRLHKTCKNPLCVRPEHNLPFYSDAADWHRFWENVEVLGDDDCWLWAGSMRPDKFCGGRARFRDHTGKSHYAYRWLLGLSDYDGESVVMHKCDDGMCVNPSHLTIGTQQQNVDDMLSKWRHMHGERHTGAVLRDEDVRHIRERWRSGERQKHIAEDMGLDKVTVWAVVHEKTWRHVT